MSSTTVADVLVERLQQWGMEQVFGFAGDGILGALARAGDRPRFIPSLHEEVSAFQTVGYAKYGDRVGVCLATSGPGAVHLLNGLYDAKLDHVPVVIVGQQPRHALGGHAQQPTARCRRCCRCCRCWSTRPTVSGDRRSRRTSSSGGGWSRSGR